MKLTKPFQGVPDGEIYPVQYQAGDDCPPELDAAAIALGAADAPDSGAGAAGNDKLTVAQLRDELTARGIAFDPAAKKAGLQALLDAAQ